MNEMTLEEKRRQARLQQKREMAKAAQAEQQQAAVEALPEKPPAQDPTWRDRTRAVQQGQLMGWGDEATALTAAAMAKLSGDDKPFGDIYQDIVGVERSEYDRYQEENPVESLALETGGGFLTGRMMPKAMMPKPGATRANRLMKWTARNAGEGAISGAGVSDENRLQGAGVGAGLGIGLGGLIETPGGLTRTIAQRRVKVRPSGKPLHMEISPDATGAEGALGTFYRQGVGGSFGGRPNLRAQEQPFLDAADAAAATTKREAADISDQINVQRDVDLDDLAIEGQRRQTELSQATQDKVDAVKNKAVAQAEQIKNKPQAARVAEARQLRQQAVDAAIPNRVGGKARANIKNADPEAGNGLLKDWWKSNGFETVKRNTFEWNDGELIDTLRKVIREDPGLELSISQVPGMTKKMLKKLLKLKKGETPESISGKQLMAMRNVFAMASNNTSKKFEKGALRRVANEFDTFIRKRLDGEDLAGFEDELVKYGPTKLFGDAVDKAYKKNGAFDADDWLSVLPRDTRSQKKGLLQVDAQAARSRIGAAEQQAQDVLKRGGELPQETQTLTKALRRRGRKEAQSESAVLRKTRRKVRQDAAADPRLAKARAARETAKGELAETKRRAVPGTSVPSQMVTTGAFGAVPSTAAGLALGGPIGGAVGLLTSLVGGRAISATLAKRTVQEALAGRTPTQRKLAIAIKRYRGSQTEANAKAVRRAMQNAGIRETLEE